MTATGVFRRGQTHKFLEMLNKQDPATKYTTEFKDHKTFSNFSKR